MSVDRYELRSDQDANQFKFVSEGKKDKIEKIVKFIQESEGLYNLAFGDRKGIDEIDGMSRSDNGDTRKILATVATAVEVFTILSPERWIHLEGSTEARTRLYQINIYRFFSEISSMFEVYGLRNDHWGKFKPGILYQAFLVKRRRFNFK